MHLIEKNLPEIHKLWLSLNPAIFELNFSGLKERCAIYKEELIQITSHPSRLQKLLDQGISIEDLESYL
jgi:hypothetical protein